MGHEQDIRAWLSFADMLNVYGIVSRYPNEIHVDDERTKVALQYADFILQWAKQMCTK